ncbi:exported hypothetical protein [Streptomyces murinus]
MARFAITMMLATISPQPPIHPVRGPNARVAQVKVVPQSASLAFSSRKAYAISSIGTNASMVTIGAWSPTPATMIPSVAARLYAGPVDASAMTTEENIPSASPRSPFRPTPEPGAGRPPDTPLLPKSLTFDSNAGAVGVQIQGRPTGGPPSPPTPLFSSLPSPTLHAPVA